MAVHSQLIIQGQTRGLSQARTEINALYSSSSRDVGVLSKNVQQFGHHSFAAFQIFKGLAIYRGFGLLTQQLSEGVRKSIEFEKLNSPS